MLHFLNFNELLTPLYFVIALLHYNSSGYFFFLKPQQYKWTCKR